ncbi:MAG: hypothetical protein ACRCST_03630 [Turicibacter sp.]
MFVSVGTKIRELRKHFNLKQSSFEPFGYSQNHISMFEKNRRPITLNNLESIYKAFDILSEGKVCELYSYDEFILNELEQANSWLKNNCTVDYGLENYKHFIDIATQYNLITYQLQLEELLAYHHKDQRELVKSNHHFLGAISCCIQMSQNCAKYYRQIALNHLELGNYHQSVSYLIYAINQSPEDFDFIYKAYYDLGRCYLYLAEYEKSLEYVNLLTGQNEDLLFKALGILLKENVLKKSGNSILGREILIDFIEDCCYEPYLGYAYHNLACNYKDNGLYDEALEVLLKSMTLLEDEFNLGIANCLIGDIYYKLLKYDLAIEYLTMGITPILQKGNLDQKQTALESLVLSYFNNQQPEEVIQTIEKITNLVADTQLPEVFLLTLKNKLYKQLLNLGLQNQHALVVNEKLLKAIDF